MQFTGKNLLWLSNLIQGAIRDLRFEIGVQSGNMNAEDLEEIEEEIARNEHLLVRVTLEILRSSKRLQL